MHGAAVKAAMKHRITGVDAGSPAARAGVRAGWYLTEINGQPIYDVIDYEQLTAKSRITLTLEAAEAGENAAPGRRRRRRAGALDFNFRFRYNDFAGKSGAARGAQCFSIPARGKLPVCASNLQR